MSRKARLIHIAVAVIGLAVLSTLAVVPPPIPVEASASAQAAAPEELPTVLRYVPTDAAVFLSVDAVRVWDNPILKAIRKVDPGTFDALAAATKMSFALLPEDVNSIVAFVPKVHANGEQIGFGVVVTFRNAFDKEKLARGAETLLPKGVKPKVTAVNDRMALVLVNLGEEFARPQPLGKTGPLTSTLQAAATGKHVAVAGLTLASFPDELRGEMLPPQLAPFHPLFKAKTISALIDVGDTLSLDVRVKTDTERQAVDCEKSLGTLLALLQEELGEELKAVVLDATKKPAFKDLGAVMNAASTSLKGARFSTLGNETRLTLSLPTNLPFTGAYVAAKKKFETAMTVLASANNLKQIALATINYADTYNGNLPPAAICDKAGKPLLSWRVVILPFLEQEKLYKEFKLDEPWDSDHNKKLLVKMPKVYAIPGTTKPGEVDTHYRIFVGNGAGFDWIQGGRFPASFPDGTSNTILCVTAAEAVPWTKPDELAFDPDKDMGRLLGPVVNGKIQVALFDGSSVTLKKLPSKQTVNALITRAGGEVIGPDFP